MFTHNFFVFCLGGDCGIWQTLESRYEGRRWNLHPFGSVGKSRFLSITSWFNYHFSKTYLNYIYLCMHVYPLKCRTFEDKDVKKVTNLVFLLIIADEHDYCCQKLYHISLLFRFRHIEEQCPRELYVLEIQNFNVDFSNLDIYSWYIVQKGPTTDLIPTSQMLYDRGKFDNLHIWAQFLWISI